MSALTAWLRATDEADSWRDQANCLGMDPDLFFAHRGESVEEARAVCMACEVRVDCLEYAITNGEKLGLWGGLTERQRRALRAKRRRERLGLGPVKVCIVCGAGIDRRSVRCFDCAHKAARSA